MFMTPTPQFIEGVQFSLLGIQGTIARYPLHFHVCGDGGHASVIRRNVIVNSKQVSGDCLALDLLLVRFSPVLSPPPSLSLPQELRFLFPALPLFNLSAACALASM